MSRYCRSEPVYWKLRYLKQNIYVIPSRITGQRGGERPNRSERAVRLLDTGVNDVVSRDTVGCIAPNYEVELEISRMAFEETTDVPEERLYVSG